MHNIILYLSNKNNAENFILGNGARLQDVSRQVYNKNIENIRFSVGIT